MPDARKHLPTCCNGCFACTFFRFNPVVKSGDRAVRAVPDMDMSALVKDPFEIVVAFFQNASLVDMVS